MADLSFNDAVSLGAAAVLNAGAGLVTLGGTVDGTYPLTVRTTGLTTFQAPVGGTTPLASVVTNAGGTTAINAGSVRTTGTQRYSDPVTLGTNTTFTGSGATFASTIQGSGQTLSIGAGGNGVAFLSDLGAPSLPLGAIDVTSVGNVTIAGDIYSTGPVTIRSTSGGIAMTDRSVVDAGAGTILVEAAGPVALAGLVTTNATADAVRVTSTAGSITDAGDADTDIVAATPGAAVTLRAATGIGSGNALEVLAAGVTATVTSSGGIGLAALGDLTVAAGGLKAPGPIDLAATGSIRVPSGGAISGSRVMATGPIIWSVLGNADSGAGSLRRVIAYANATAVPGVAEFPAGGTLLSPASPLPAITTKFSLDGTGKGVVLDGGSRVATGLTLASTAAGSLLRGLTIKGFTATGIVLDAVAGTTVAACIIQANGNGLAASGTLGSSAVAGNTFDANRGYGIQLTAARGLSVDGNSVAGVNTSTSMGLYATGDLTGTTITSNTFSTGLRGALLDSARNLVFGMVGRGNRLLANRAAPGTDFAGTGIRAQGDLAGTTVRANTFSGNNYGMAFVNARNIVFGGTAPGEANTINKSSVAALFVEGDCSGSATRNTVYGTGPQANAKKIQRITGSKGL